MSVAHEVELGFWMHIKGQYFGFNKKLFDKGVQSGNELTNIRHWLLKAAKGPLN